MKELMNDKRGILNMHKLTALGPNKLHKKLTRLLDGEYLYRTGDGRILDFKNGIEYAAPPKKFDIQKSYYDTRPRRREVQVTFYPISHVNRSSKSKKKKKRK